MRTADILEVFWSFRSPYSYIALPAGSVLPRRRGAVHWGVPTMVYRGAPFFGQDRIDVRAWRLARQAEAVE